MKSKNRGFTLIELMIVVLIVGVLVAVAYPRYNEHIKRGNRTEGQAFLSEIAARQERYFSQNNEYLISDDNSNDFSGLGLSNPAESATKKYQLEITLEDTDGGYTLIAKQQFNDSKCGDLILNGLGIKGHTGAADSAVQCWR